MAHGLISTGASFPDSSTQTTAAAITPVGAVMTCVPNITTPTGWVHANNAIVKTTYPALYSVIGDVYDTSQIPNRSSGWGTELSTMRPWVPQNVQYMGNKFATNGASVYIMIGDAGRVYRSTDAGATWAVTTPINGTDCFGIGFGNGRFVMVGGSNKILYSTNDGSSWTAGTMTATTGNNVTFGNGVWVMGCNSGIIQRSTDGVTFATVQDTGNQNHWVAAFGNGYFVMAGSDGQVWTSTDGTTWTQRVVDLSAAGGTSEDIHDIRYDSVNGRFYGCAQNGIILYTNNNNPTSGWNVISAAATNGTVDFDYQTCCYLPPLGIYLFLDAANNEGVWTHNFNQYFRSNGTFSPTGDTTITYQHIYYDSVNNVFLFNSNYVSSVDGYGNPSGYSPVLYRSTNIAALSSIPPLTHFWVSGNYANSGTYFGQTAKILVKA
jgi:photosystem II stability/assembly factor-like uncharacterized protein